MLEHHSDVSTLKRKVLHLQLSEKTKAKVDKVHAAVRECSLFIKTEVSVSTFYGDTDPDDDKGESSTTTFVWPPS